MQNKKSPIPLRIISLICLLVWMGLIFYLSGQTASESSAVSGGLIKTIINLIMPSASPEAVAAAVSALQFIVRKGAHFTLYGVLGILSFLTFVTYERLGLSLRFFLSSLVGLLYAMSDEYHQTFISGRSGEIRDVLIDTAGVLCGVIFSLIIYGLSRSLKNKRVSKMRKKQYIELTEALQQRLNRELDKSEELEIKIGTLSKENAALHEEISKLKEEILKFEDKNAEEAVEESEFTEEQPEEEVLEPVLEEGVLDGAKIIGKIVVSSAQYCNELTASGASTETKELLNLILGRTEVAKAEILRLSNLNVDPKERFSAMEKEMRDAEDYFKSVMAQK